MLTPRQIVEQAVQDGKISGSWLVSGPYGVGKKEFAQHVCGFLTSGRWRPLTDFHPDVMWVECPLTEEARKEVQKAILEGGAVGDIQTKPKKKEITIDVVRAGIHFLSLKGAAISYRIAVVHLADEMNEEAQNALLKMLEEPYPRSVLLLLCQNTGKILPTIRSRCRQIILRPMSAQAFKEALRQKYPHVKDIDWIAELSGGSLGAARDIIENNGLELYQKAVSFCVPIGELQIEALQAFADEAAAGDKAWALVQQFVLDWCRRQAARDEKGLDVFKSVQRLLSDTERIYLDKKQALMTCFFKIAEALE
ncbi:MAG: hypothetical protein PHX68_00100 [Alphaproteobacteria bacterium]|nr:hypothetical protein [Alphaproteobacteria bacterium]